MPARCYLHRADILACFPTLRHSVTELPAQCSRWCHWGHPEDGLVGDRPGVCELRNMAGRVPQLPRSCRGFERYSFVTCDPIARSPACKHALPCHDGCADQQLRHAVALVLPHALVGYHQQHVCFGLWLISLFFARWREV